MNIKDLINNTGKLQYKELCNALIERFGVKQPVKWDSVLPHEQQQTLFGGEILRAVSDHPTLATQKEIRPICLMKGELSQLLFFYVQLKDEKLPKTAIERITRKFIGGMTADRYVIWFLGNKNADILKIVISGKEGKKVRLKTLTLEAGKWFKTYDYILNEVERRFNTDGLFQALKEPSGLWQAIWEAFDISIVNKKFYAEIKAVFDTLTKEILPKRRGILTYEQDRVQFAIRLIGRIIFCWFLKRKGIVDDNVMSAEAVVKQKNYYSDLLEPLFFDVFNTPFNERRKDLLDLIKDYPFLNGGLFEPNVNDYKGNWALNLPNDWFMDFFGNTLERYNFTIDENSAASSEIAIDPEMLGRIFENLLAEQNPETGESARKATGSYYTPREIVDFMVEESLIAYLKTSTSPSPTPSQNGNTLKLSSSLVEEGKIDGKLDFFIDDFVHTGIIQDALKPIAKQLLDKLNLIKVLDPACGSGAFPISMLQKLAGLKQQLEPKSSPYKLKLQTIENSIYGIDIQPMATELSRLRCWLSLIVDEDPKDVKPLPNLDFKFVTANSLVDLGYDEFIDKVERGKIPSLFLINFVKGLNALKEVRHKYFEPTLHQGDKEILKKEFNRINTDLFKMSIELIKDKVLDAEFANKITGWDPFDDSKPAPFFNKNWMFGIEDGFDITLGNPPYVRADSGEQHLALRKKIIAGKQFETLWEKWDLYIPFIEQGYKLLKPYGITTMIVSDAYCHAKYAQKSQNWFLQNSRILRLDFLSKIKVFDAGVHNIVYFFQKCDGGRNKPERRVHEGVFGNASYLLTDEQQNLNCRAFFPESNSDKYTTKATVVMEKICYVCVGMVVNAHEKLAPGAFDMDDLVVDLKDNIHTKAFVEGKHLSRWVPITNKYLEWGTKRAPCLFRRPTFPEIYEVNEKILVQRSPGPDPKACYDNNHLYFTESSVGFILWHHLSGVRNNSLKKVARYCDEKPLRPDLPNREDLEKTSSLFAIKYLLGVMNSSIAHDFLRANRRSNIHLYPDDWKQLPIPVVAADRQQPIVKLVDKILEIKKWNKTADVVSLENEIDKLVYDLYNLPPDEIAIVEGKN